MNKRLLPLLFILLLSLAPVFATQYTFQEDFSDDGNVDDYNYITFDIVSEELRLPYHPSVEIIYDQPEKIGGGYVGFGNSYSAICNQDEDLNVVNLSDGTVILEKKIGTGAFGDQCVATTDDSNVFVWHGNYVAGDFNVDIYDLSTGNLSGHIDSNFVVGLYSARINVDDNFIIIMDRVGIVEVFNKKTLDLNKAFYATDNNCIWTYNKTATHLDENYYYTYTKCETGDNFPAFGVYRSSAKIYSLPDFVEVADLNGDINSSYPISAISSNEEYAFYNRYGRSYSPYQYTLGIINKSNFNTDYNYIPPLPTFAGGISDGHITYNMKNFFGGRDATSSSYHLGDFNVFDINKIFVDSLPIQNQYISNDAWTFMTPDGNFYFATGKTAGSHAMIHKVPNFIDNYTTESQIISSTDINFSTNCIGNATINANENIPIGTTIQYYLSNDGGLNWHLALNHFEFVFPTCSYGLRWRAILTTTNSSISPQLMDLNITYEDGNFYADFNYSPIPPIILDPENGVNSSTVDFEDVSLYNDENSWQASSWYINGTFYSNDQNISYNFTNAGDMNIFVIITNTGDVNDTITKIIKIKQYPQDVNFLWNPIHLIKDANSYFYGSCDEDKNIDYWYWDFPSGIDANTDQNISHIFAETGDQNVCLTVHDYNDDLNKTKCHIVLISSNLIIQFWDEYTETTMQPTVFINGTDYSALVSATGVLDVNLIGKVISIWAYTANHETRYWDVNLTNDKNYNFLLLPTTLGKTIDFKFWDENGLVVLGNSWITVKHGPEGKFAGLLKTNEAGETQFFLNVLDGNYSFIIVEPDGTTHDYNRSIVTVRQPKDIITQGPLTPYDLTVTELGNFNYSNVAIDQDVNIFNNTVDYYLFTVDFNSDYYPTSKLINIEGNLANEYWQPFLVSKAEGIEVTIYTIDNTNNRTSLSGILIESYTDINGVSTLVESKKSDDTGVALFHFELGREYTLYFYQNGVLKLTLTIVPSSSNLFAFIDTGTFSEDAEMFGTVQVEWYSSSNIVPINYIASFVQMLTPNNTIIGDVNITVTQNDILIYNTIINANSGTDFNLAYDVNVAGLEQYIPVRITLDIYDTSGHLITSVSGTYTIVASVVWEQGLKYLRLGFGTLASVIIILLLFIYLLSFVTRNRIGEDNSWLFIITSLGTGMVMFLGFIPFIPWVLGTFFALTVTVWRFRD